MTLQVRSRKDLAAGGLFFVVGAVWALACLQYRVGSAVAMGPGYFPLAAALVLAGLGFGSMLRSLWVVEAGGIGPWPGTSLLFILGGVVGFGLLLEPLGLLAAGTFLLAACCWSRWRTRPFETLMLAVGLMALVSGVFVFGLGITVDLY